MYGLMNKPSETYFIIPSLHYWYYEERKKESTGRLRYTSVTEMIEKFVRGEEGSFYAFPMLPQEFSVTSFILSSESWLYAPMVRRATKNMFPRLTSYTAIQPGGKFLTYVAVNGEARLPRYIRIGKKRSGIMKLDYNELKVKEVLKARNQPTSFPVNYKDVKRFGFKVISFSKLLQSPNIDEGDIGWAVVEECTVLVTEEGELCLPLPLR